VIRWTHMTDDESPRVARQPAPGSTGSPSTCASGGLRGCTLDHRIVRRTDLPDDREWLVGPDSIEYDEPEIRVSEASMRPAALPRLGRTSSSSGAKPVAAARPPPAPAEGTDRPPGLTRPAQADRYSFVSTNSRWPSASAHVRRPSITRSTQRQQAAPPASRSVYCRHSRPDTSTSTCSDIVRAVSGLARDLDHRHQRVADDVALPGREQVDRRARRAHQRDELPRQPRTSP